MQTITYNKILINIFIKCIYVIMNKRLDLATMIDHLFNCYFSINRVSIIQKIFNPIITRVLQSNIILVKLIPFILSCVLQLYSIDNFLAILV